MQERSDVAGATVRDETAGSLRHSKDDSRHTLAVALGIVSFEGTAQHS